MCKGKADEDVQEPVRLREIQPAPQIIAKAASTPSTEQSSYRPESSKHRPMSSKHRPESSKHRPMSSKHRPESSKHRPESSRHRSGGSSSGERRDRPRERPIQGIPLIPEYPEDRTIVALLAKLTTFIGQHAAYYYSHNGRDNQRVPELDNPRTRHAAIRQYVAQQVIQSIIVRDRNRYEKIPFNNRNTQLITFKGHQMYQLP
jgi:hypothetical protein